MSERIGRVFPTEERGSGARVSTTRQLADTRPKLLGLQAERYFKRHLIELGWAVLAQNFRGQAGEIDLIANRGSTLLCLEVKARRLGVGLREEDEAAEQAVNQRKFYKMQGCMLEFARRYGYLEYDIRYCTGVYYVSRGGEKLCSRIVAL